MCKQDAVLSGGQLFSLDKSWNIHLKVDSKFQHTFRNVSSLLLVLACGSVDWLTFFVSLSHPMVCCNLIYYMSEFFFLLLTKAKTTKNCSLVTTGKKSKFEYLRFLKIEILTARKGKITFIRNLCVFGHFFLVLFANIHSHVGKRDFLCIYAVLADHL